VGEAGLAPTSNYVFHLAGHPRITDPENIDDDRRGEACLARSLLSDTIGCPVTLFTDYSR
jgi:hypothetical protein